MRSIGLLFALVLPGCGSIYKTVPLQGDRCEVVSVRVKSCSADEDCPKGSACNVCPDDPSCPDCDVCGDPFCEPMECAGNEDCPDGSQCECGGCLPGKK